MNCVNDQAGSFFPLFLSREIPVVHRSSKSRCFLYKIQTQQLKKTFTKVWNGFMSVISTNILSYNYT